MIDDMTIRNMTPGTQKIYVRSVQNFSRHFGCSSDKLTFENVREYQPLLGLRALEPQNINQIICALRFFCGTTPGMADVAKHIPSHAGPIHCPPFYCARSASHSGSRQKVRRYPWHPLSRRHRSDLTLSAKRRARNGSTRAFN
jgi:Phage integrase, N-terminal SAM-like domain